MAFVGLYAADVQHHEIPVFDYRLVRPLRFWGERCPVCRGTTTVNRGGVQYCYSCDQTWDIHGKPTGVVTGIGARLGAR